MADSATGQLPLEIRALTQFLRADDRPTAIFEDGGVTTRDWPRSGIIFQNDAFKRAPFAEESVKEAITRFRKGVEDVGHVGEKSVPAVEPQWEIRQVGQLWLVLVGGRSQTSLTPAAADGPPLANGVAGTDHPHHDNRSDSRQPQSQDWTQSEYTGTSSWIQRVRAFDWASTGLGPMHSWDAALRGYVLHMMNNPSPRILLWGPEKTLIYNEASITTFCERHPNSLGRPAREVWKDIWDRMGPISNAVYDGEVKVCERMPLTLCRNSMMKDSWWDLTLLPLIDTEGKIAGLLNEVTEVTAAVTDERRRNLLMSIKDKIRQVSSLQDLYPLYLEGLRSGAEDISLSMFYSVVDEEAEIFSDSGYSESNLKTSKRCVLEGTTGFEADSSAVCASFSLDDDADVDSGIATVCRQAYRTQETIILKQTEGTLPAAVAKEANTCTLDDDIRTIIVSPINSLAGNDVLGVLVLGFNPRRSFDEDDRILTHFLTEILTKNAALISLPEEQRRAQKIADDMNTALAQQLRNITLQAERSEARFSRMAAAAPTGMFVYDVDGRPLYLNEAYLDLIGQTREQHAGWDRSALYWLEVLHEEDLQRFKDEWARLKEQKVPITIEYRLKKPWTSVDKATGEEITAETWLMTNAFPDVSDGQIQSIQGWTTDISHRKFGENLISRKLEEALENKRQSENFIDMTSHEMRNPLSAILQSADSIVETLQTSPASGLSGTKSLGPEVVHDVVDAAETIILCAQHQKRIVDDILTLSKLDASLLVISPDKVHPPSLIDKALKMYEGEMHRAGISTNVIIEPTYRQLGIEWLVLDHSRLLQVIINLLTNAIKFTQYAEERHITLCLGASYERPSGKHHGVKFIPPRYTRAAHTPLADWGDGEEVYLQIAVIDTGKGLSETEMGVLFQRFSQASPKTYTQYGGSGLGLFISRELCELQDGQIGVSCNEGKTSFTFFVRAKLWSPSSNKLPAHRPGMHRFTSTAASPVTFSRRGSTLSPHRTNSQQDRRPRFGSTNESQQRLKRRQTDDSSVMQEEFDDDTTISESEPPTPSPTQLHVLIVEDNLINQKVMSKQLRKAGCVVHVANHGLECLSFLDRTTFTVRTPSDDDPISTHKPATPAVPLSIILLDLEMPVMDGMTCIRQIRERQLDGLIDGHVPVIAITANARSEQIHTAIEAGMDSIVTKPFRIPELIPQMHALVQEHAAGVISPLAA